MLNDNPYTIERILPGRQVTLRNGDTLAATGVKTVAEKSNSLLGVDVKLFQNIFYSDQDELRESLDFSPEERRVFIERLLEGIRCKQAISKCCVVLLVHVKPCKNVTVSGAVGAFEM